MRERFAKPARFTISAMTQSLINVIYPATKGVNQVMMRPLRERVILSDSEIHRFMTREHLAIFQ